MVKARKLGTRSPDKVDVVVGQRIRVERLNKRISQTDLANAVGVTFQQVQKYEKGLNRVGAGRLTLIAEKLGIPVTTLFEPATAGDGRGQFPLELLSNSRVMRLVKAFNRIENSNLQQAIVRFVELSADRTD